MAKKKGNLFGATVEYTKTEKGTSIGRKPDVIRDRIVELMGDLPRIELFARQRTEGWDCWGNEV